MKSSDTYFGFHILMSLATSDTRKVFYNILINFLPYIYSNNSGRKLAYNKIYCCVFSKLDRKFKYLIMYRNMHILTYRCSI